MAVAGRRGAAAGQSAGAPTLSASSSFCSCHIARRLAAGGQRGAGGGQVRGVAGMGVVDQQAGRRAVQATQAAFPTTGSRISGLKVPGANSGELMWHKAQGTGRE